MVKNICSEQGTAKNVPFLPVYLRFTPNTRVLSCRYQFALYNFLPTINFLLII